jgi:plastocyanin
MKLTFAVVLLAVAAACGSSPTMPTPTSVNATIVNGGFTPNAISISVGSSVMWTNKDSVAHSIVADDGAFNSGTINPGGQYTYAFPTAGVFPYHDASNGNMAGTVTVSGSSSTSPY